MIGQWQDLLLTVGGLILTIALIPTIRAKEKPQLSTSAITATVLYSFGIVYASLGLWLAFVSIMFNASLWAMLFVQKLRRKDAVRKTREER